MIENIKSVLTFTASIYIGTRHGYSNNEYTKIEDIHKWLENYCNKVKLGLTLTPTEFIYVGGYEPGVIVGLINYPRFPKPNGTIKKYSLEIAEGLMELCKQERVSVVFSDETIMLENSSND